MTKEEILNTKNWSSEYPNYMAENNIHDAMDEYSRQMAIAFAEWMVKRTVRPIGKNLWEDHGNAGDGGCPVVTTEQLYNLFLEQDNKEAIVS